MDQTKINETDGKQDLHGDSSSGWIGIDLDGTLAFYDGWKGYDHIGEPIKPMVDRVKKWLNQGKNIKIMTARVSPYKGDHIKCREKIEEWLISIFGRMIPITHEKDHLMIELWDDRAIQIIPNTGRRADGEE